MRTLLNLLRTLICVFLHRDDWIIQPYDRNTNHGHCRECGRTWATPSHRQGGET